MPENDIYNNERRYKRFVENIKKYLKPPAEKERKRKYWIKCKDNIIYFRELFDKFNARDTSYIRRVRLLRTFLIVNHVIRKDLEAVERTDIDKLLAFSHTVNKSPKSKRDFALDVKFIWRQLFPEKDEKGRIDETITPYPVRHLTGKVDKSKEKLRGDKFSLEEFERLVGAFSDDVRMQALLTVSLESLARPQELLERKFSEVEMHDNYAKIYITQHGKEGIGFLRIVDSYHYFAKWYNMHPTKKGHLFINTGRVNRYKQMTPFAANKLIRDRCHKIGIDKPITLYSLKRNGVTMMRLAGKSDLDIQHTARWTSSKQLKTYDLSNQEESFKLELIKRGKIKLSKKEKERFKEYLPQSKTCVFCGFDNGLAESICEQCKRPLDREAIEKEAKYKDNEMLVLKEQMLQMQEQIAEIVAAKLKKRL